MRWFNTLRMRARSVVWRSQMERELESELRFHVNQQTDENLRAGMSAEAALQSALRATGGMSRIKEECRESLGLRWLDQLSQDVHYALRIFRRSPGVTATAVVSLAVGI